MVIRIVWQNRVIQPNNKEDTVKCICRDCNKAKKPSEMLKHSISGLPTEVCMMCVVAKRATTRLNNSPKAPLMDVRAGFDLIGEIKRLKQYMEVGGRKVRSMAIEKGKDGAELVLEFIDTKRIPV